MTPAERARAARLVARANTLQRAIVDTEAAATRADIKINTSKLKTLRDDARVLAGGKHPETGRPTRLLQPDPDANQSKPGRPAEQSANRTDTGTDGQP